MESAPEPPTHREDPSVGATSDESRAVKGTTSKSGLARVTSYNKLERQVEIEDDVEYSQPSISS